MKKEEKLSGDSQILKQAVNAFTNSDIERKYSAMSQNGKEYVTACKMKSFRGLVFTMFIKKTL